MTEEMTEENTALENLDRLAEESPEQDDEWLDDQEAAREADAEQEAREMAAAHGAAMAVSFSETLLLMKYPFVEIDGGTKQAVEAKAAAVLAKHGGGLPEWLVPYKEEIDLGIILAVAGFGIAQQVSAHEQAEQEAREKEAREKGEGVEDAHETE